MHRIGRRPLAVAAAALVAPLSSLGQGMAEKTLPEVTVVSEEEAVRRRQQDAIPRITVPAEDLERFADATVGDVLRRVPGMTFTGPPGVVKDIRMRGLDKGYTGFLIDGEPIATGKKERQIQVDRLPADMIERIEIIRSPSAAYDANGIGGTVNIVLKESAREDATRLRASHGRNGSLESGDGIVQLFRRYESLDASMLASYTQGAEDVREVKDKYNAAGVFTERERKARPVKKDELLVAPRFRWRLDASSDLTLEPTLSRGSERKNEPSMFTNAAGVLTKTAEKTEDKVDEVARIGLRYTRRSGADLRWSLKAGVEHGEEDKGLPVAREYNAAGVLTRTTLAPEVTREERGYAGAGAELRRGDHRVQAGIDLARTDYENRKKTFENGVDRTGPRDNFAVEEDKAALFVQDEWQVAPRHWLTPGARHEWIERRTADNLAAADAARASFTHPSLHYRWALTDALNLRSSAARTVRMPRFDDVNPLVALAGGANTALNPDTAGNPALQPERATGLDAGAELGRPDGALVGVNVFARQVDGFIQRVTALEGARFVSRPQNVGEARFRGLELDWKAPFRLAGGALTLLGNYSRLQGEVRSATTGATGDVKDLPPYVANLGADFATGRWGFGANASYQPGFTANSTNTDNGLREVKIKNRQTLLDAYVMRRLGKGAELRLVGKNLLRVEKIEETIKYNAAGASTGSEVRSETSAPTVYLTFEYRY